MKFRLPKCLLFDLDGTILDSLPGIVLAVHEACRSVGLPEPKVDLRLLLGPPIKTILSKAAGTDDPFLLDRLERSFRASYDSEGWQKTSCFDGASETLAALHAQRHRLFIVSNKPRHISVRILEHEGLLPLFERIYTRDSRIPPWVSKEEILLGFLTENRLRSSDCLMVGDTMEDAEAAAATGMDFIFMNHGYGQLRNTHSCYFVLDNFSQFLASITKEPVLD